MMTRMTLADGLRFIADETEKDDPRQVTANLRTLFRNSAETMDLLAEALKLNLRTLQAVRYTAGLGKGQVERMEKARAILRCAGYEVPE